MREGVVFLQASVMSAVIAARHGGVSIYGPEAEAQF